MKNKTTKRVKSIIDLAEIIGECESCGVLYNYNRAMLMFKDNTGQMFFANVLSNGNVKLEYLDGNTYKPYKWSLPKNKIK